PRARRRSEGERAWWSWNPPGLRTKQEVCRHPARIPAVCGSVLAGCERRRRSRERVAASDRVAAPGLRDATLTFTFNSFQRRPALIAARVARVTVITN